MSNITITSEQVDAILNSSVIEDKKIGLKTTVVVATFKSGFVIVESSSCVDPENYDHEIGRKICLERIKNEIWKLEGYRLQCEVSKVI